MHGVVPRAVQIASRPWDIGTGVRGYAWDAPRPRAALLLQHGFAEYAERYVHQYSAVVSHLLDIGLSVYAFDLQGHGRSPGRRVATDVERAVTDHLAARRMLAVQPLPLFLLGHSLGGIVAATSVVHDPTCVRGVILSSPVLQVTANPVERIFARPLAALLPFLPVRRIDRADLSRLREQVALVENDPLMYHGAMPARLAASILSTTRANWPRYREWRAPTLVIHGTADRITEVEGSRRFIETIASEDRTLHLVDGGYHELLNDIGREETLRVVLEWLERRLRTIPTA